MQEGFGIYIHWPFCLSKCPYCDFNSYAVGTKNTDGLENAYLAQLEHFSHLTAEKTVTSIFFGGGTPSLMNPRTVEAVIKTVQKLWKTAPDIEISMEANPATVDDFSKFYNAGINRLSIGIQALNDEALKFLGRKHNLKEALQAIENAKKVFSNVSIDLIYARPEQSLSDWKQELEQALTFDVNHMSLYQLSIEKGTPFHQRKNLKLPDENTAVEMFETTQEMTALAGLPAYEISNHGKKCKHNMTYWLGGDYAGVGAGAHSR
ncbi:MAG: radical SAM family heme chaperone HemW, partial [Alphaproteobacteria bacterium]|nr:radical SAM family heme chaperone HemW [Alphaproteobacteria bacterium]